MTIKQLGRRYQNHITILLSSNIIGFLNLVFSFLILHFSNEQDYNIYTAYASLFLIFNTPSKFLKSLSTTYGENLFAKYKIGVKLNLISIALSSLILILLTIVVTQITKGNLFASLFLILAVFAQVYIAIFTGLFQHNQEFIKPAILLFGQNVVKVTLGLALYVLLKNTGLWFIVFIGAFAFAYAFVASFKKHRKKQTNTSLNIMIDSQDIISNLFILISIDLLFNIDSIFVVNKLDTSSAYIYNSLVLIKKSLYFSLLGISQIVLSGIKKEKLSKLVLLAENLGVTLIISIVVASIFIIFKDLVFSLIKLSNEYFYLYLKFILASILFNVLSIISLWFISVKNTVVKAIIPIIFLTVILLYYINITTLDHFLNIYIFGIITLLLIELGMIGVKVFKNK